MTCKHRRSWLIRRGSTWYGMLWCPDCGAIRNNTSQSKCWVYPKGQEVALKLLKKEGGIEGKNEVKS
jgi:hypothetical protein